MMIRIGTRTSSLAMAQTKMVAEALKQALPEIEAEIIGISTEGDRRMEASLASFGGKGVFTEALEQLLCSGSLDLAVHSAKDLPVLMRTGLEIGAVLPRGDVRDVLLTTEPLGTETLTGSRIIGTGSARRRLQMLEIAPAVRFRDIRGNIPTRLRHLAEDDYDAVILAAAGLKRLGYIPENSGTNGSFEAEGYHFYYYMLDPHIFLPAAGQGIIAVQRRSGDLERCLEAVNDRETQLMLIAEKAFLAAVGGGCNAAAAISCEVTEGYLILRAKYASDTEEMKMTFVRKALSGDPEKDILIAEQCGRMAAGRLLKHVLRSER